MTDPSIRGRPHPEPGDADPGERDDPQDDKRPSPAPATSDPKPVEEKGKEHP